MPKRVLLILGACILLALPAVYLLRPERGVPDDAPTEDQMADAIGAPVMEHLYRGHVPGRSAEVMLVPKPNNFLLGEWDLTSLGTATPDLSSSHPNPWAYLARVPLIFYGPGYVPEGVEIDDVVDIADVAPTYARLLGVDGMEFDGEPLDDALEATPPRLPKVIFSIVIDGGGWNTLQAHHDSWPNIARLRREGTTYVNATIGSAPSITGALHPTFGTGSYPLHHGIPGNQMRDPDGKNVDTWLQDADPRYLELPTVSELWDEQNDNEPVVGTVSFEGWHLGMIGSGAQREGGDKDIAVLWETLEEEWWVNEDFYDFPDYLAPTDLDTLSSYEAELDPRDGLVDGTWFGHTLDELQEPQERPSTPAFVRFTGDAVVDVMRNEGLGDDHTTDMFWVEMKMPDFAGHEFNMTGPEEGDVVLETDRQIGRFVEELEQSAGRGNYIVMVSADHGQQPLPDLVGGWRINNLELVRDIEDRFGDVVEKITPVDIYLDMDKLDDERYTASDIARYVGTYTLGANIPDRAPGADRVPDARRDELLFAGAFSTGYFQSLTPQKIATFGDSDYPEGTFVRVAP